MLDMVQKLGRHGSLGNCLQSMHSTKGNSYKRPHAFEYGTVESMTRQRRTGRDEGSSIVRSRGISACHAAHGNRALPTNFAPDRRTPDARTMAIATTGTIHPREKACAVRHEAATSVAFCARIPDTVRERTMHGPTWYGAVLGEDMNSVMHDNTTRPPGGKACPLRLRGLRPCAGVSIIGHVRP